MGTTCGAGIVFRGWPLCHAEIRSLSPLRWHRHRPMYLSRGFSPLSRILNRSGFIPTDRHADRLVRVVHPRADVRIPRTLSLGPPHHTPTSTPGEEGIPPHPTIGCSHACIASLSRATPDRPWRSASDISFSVSKRPDQLYRNGIILSHRSM